MKKQGGKWQGAKYPCCSKSEKEHEAPTMIDKVNKLIDNDIQSKFVTIPEEENHVRSTHQVNRCADSG